MEHNNPFEGFHFAAFYFSSTFIFLIFSLSWIGYLSGAIYLSMMFVQSLKMVCVNIHICALFSSQYCKRMKVYVLCFFLKPEDNCFLHKLKIRL